VEVLPEPGTPAHAALEARGLEALRNGEAALVVLAGGMATRMGGVVKALVEALDGQRFIDLRLKELESLSEKVGRAVPLWLMTSHATHEKTEEAIQEAKKRGLDVATFRQRLAPRLTADGHLFRDAAGELSLHAPGHGDLVDALKDSGLIQAFLERGGKTVTVANLDNLGGGIDPVILGFHLSHGDALSCEVVDKEPGDRGGIPARLDGRRVVLEEFRLPEDVDPTHVPVFNTNTFHFDAQRLCDVDVPWTFFRVEKSVGEAKAIQFERLLGELTSYLDTRFLRLPRSGAGSRFLPVKDFAELDARRDAIRLVAEARGML
jgi:UTP--glucose-1-phosphate uridylyltransferase